MVPGLLSALSLYINYMNKISTYVKVEQEFYWKLYVYFINPGIAQITDFLDSLHW
jgi:hypothetical protein